MCVQVAEKGVAHLKHQTNDKNSELEDAVLFREVDMCWNRPDGRVKLHHVETTTQRSPCIFALQEQWYVCQWLTLRQFWQSTKKACCSNNLLKDDQSSWNHQSGWWRKINDLQTWVLPLWRLSKKESRKGWREGEIGKTEIEAWGR